MLLEDLKSKPIFTHEETRESLHKDIEANYPDHSLNDVIKWLRMPPRFSTLRVNLKKQSRTDLMAKITDMFKESFDEDLIPVVASHEVLDDVITIESKEVADFTPSKEELMDESKAVLTDAFCGQAVLRGADIFAPGIKACGWIQPGDVVNIFVDLDNEILKGATKNFSLDKMLFIGQGKCHCDRYQLFGRDVIPKGVAVSAIQTVLASPNLNQGEKDGLYLLQNLPSIIAGYLVNPQEGDLILDMCAAPGGKTTHLASFFKNQGKVVAIDRSQRKIDQIKANAERMGVSNFIELHVGDSTKLLRDQEHFPAGKFDKILLDAPCSALGQRPQFLHNIKHKELKSFIPVQRKLFREAVDLLKSGGILVYSTCTITAAENEELVHWALEKFGKSMQPLPLSTAHPGLFSGKSDGCNFHRFGTPSSKKSSSPDNDTIGFYVATFRKS